ncbi:MAG: class I SAM-dependent methyltransferase [Actinomycetota bacterium]|nr:class I SAM-dependent methyltransferase [Actinomycetota bacterium]
MSLEPTPIPPDLAAYVDRHFSGRDEALRLVEEETAALGDLAVMQTDPGQAALLEMLARVSGAQRAIEIGTFTGYGAIRIARGLGEDGTLLCCELDPERAKTARANLERAGVGDRVQIQVGPAIATLRALPADPFFDFAYLDADKTGYPDYYEELITRLRPNGLLAIDNVLMGGRVLNPDPGDEGALAVAELNDRITADRRVDSVLLGMADGLTLVRRRV